MQGLAGKRVLITGAATGIGRAAAVRLATEGANVAVNFIGDPEPAEALIEELSAVGPDGTHILAPADISDEDAVDSLFADVVQSFGGLDVLVNNAGVKRVGEPHETRMVDYDKIMSVNLRGSFLCAQAAIQHYLDVGHPGVIVTTSSIHQSVPLLDAIAYTMSKSGLLGMTETLALRYARDGIRVNAVGPGAIMTPMNSDLAADMGKLRAIEDTIPFGRIGAPEEIAAVIAFLASDEASYITGQTIFADGGLMIARPG